MPEIGTTLREARMRARIDVSEIEEQTKIRARYLRALENEEWGLLPGPAYTKSFLRAYAQALGLDGRALVDEYKATYESNGDGERVDVPHRAPRSRRPRPRPSVGPPRLSRGYVIAALTACVVIVLALIGILSHSSSTPTASHRPTHRAHARHHAHRSTGASAAAPSGAATGSSVTVSLRPTGRIWVCLVEEGGRKLIPGTILLPEEAAKHTYHSARFEINLGNNDVELLVNGRRQSVPASAEPIGYSITTSGVNQLTAGHLPTCA
jgi:transcriptional regulator with XRE-family HTH domain